jgi:hypothetical protein
VRDINLQDFVTNTVARSRITFGDVRRLQRDCLPGGITTHEEAEALIGLNASLGRADRAWAQWLVAAIADFAERRERLGVVADQGTADWLERLLGTTATSTSVGRRIAREIRREVARLHQSSDAPAEASVDAAPAAPPQSADGATATPADPVPPTPRKTRKPKRSAVAPRSRIIVRSKTRARPAHRPRCDSNPLTMPPLVWSAVAAKHLHFRLAAPCA